MQTDYLIIGQGLAGSMLAWALLQRGCRVMVVDQGGENASSIAAGIINPVTGLRFVANDNIGVLLPAAHKLYANLSQHFNKTLYHPMPMMRLFQNATELKHYQKRQRQSEYLPYFSTCDETFDKVKDWHAPFGYVEQQHTGYLATKTLLDCLHTDFQKRKICIKADFDYQLALTPTSVTWQGITARRIIFCEGYRSIFNPWFSWLPMQPAKGEILTVQRSSIDASFIYNFGNWLLPIEERRFRLGATFDVDTIDTVPTEAGKQQLLTSFARFYRADNLNDAIIDHQANIRPCTQDKQPILGAHPEIANMFIFNGFGAKGSLQIPWHAEHFVDFLLTHSPLQSACGIHRTLPTHFARQTGA
jgi:glycine/D-amino acid oxidase-like deaminating enzyme